MPVEPALRTHEMTKINILVLEDDPHYLMTLESLIDKGEKFEIETTTNYEKAQSWILDGKFHIFLTDLKIKTKLPPKRGRSKNRVVPKNAIDILRRIKDKKSFVNSIATSNYSDELQRVKDGKYADYALEKSESTHPEITRIIRELQNNRMAINTHLYEALINLYNFTFGQDFESCVFHLQKTKDNLLKLLKYIDSAPPSHQKAFWVLRTISFHLSAVPSPQINLNDVTPEAYEFIEKLFLDSSKPNFDFVSQARPIIKELESMGYRCLPRVKAV